MVTVLGYGFPPKAPTGSCDEIMQSLATPLFYIYIFSLILYVYETLVTVHITLRI